jgi:hypothetical protein
LVFSGREYRGKVGAGACLLDFFLLKILVDHLASHDNVVEVKVYYCSIIKILIFLLKI